MKIILFPFKLIAAILLFFLSLIFRLIGAFVVFVSTVWSIIGTLIGVVVCISTVMMTVMLLFIKDIDPKLVVICWIFAFLWFSTLFWGIKVGEWISNTGLALGKFAKSLLFKKEEN